ncbi:HutD family protein [Demequina rhizosphaerae]|uniref:HutD family protein n=1 Tax=Demequina rhizosphaerae TaxID=1638985 RepID=UPI000AD03030|nr:HutD family protein [Demequina rhizosphaerae]
MREPSATVARMFAAQPRVAWFNGAGFTTELVSFDDSARLWPDLAPWRLSVAELTRTGPFSPVPGVTRSFCPVGGDVVLRVDGRETRVGELEVLTFDGGADTALVELLRACHAVNLMSRDDARDQVSMRHDRGPASGAGLAVIALEGDRRFDVLAPPDDVAVPRLRIERSAQA